MTTTHSPSSTGLATRLLAGQAIVLVAGLDEVLVEDGWADHGGNQADSEGTGDQHDGLSGQ